MVTAPAAGPARPTPLRPLARAADRLRGLGRAGASPYLLLVLAVIFWSGNAIVGRAFNDAIPPIALSFWRWVVGCAFLLPFTGRDVWRSRGVIVRHWRLLVLYDALGVVGCNVLTYAALHDTTAVNSSLMNSTTPIFVMCASFLLFRDRVQGRQLIGVGVSLLGVVAIVSSGRLGNLGALALNRGDLMMLGGIGLWSIYTALLRRKPEGLAPMAFLTVLMALGVLLELPVYLVELGLGATFAPTVPNLLAIVYIGVFPAALALYFWNRAVAALGANRCSVFVHLMPVFGTVLAVIFLGERFGVHHALGIALIFAGVYLAAARRRATVA
jgi:drug/metabolite transporter (DMT)-like permease